MKTLLEIFFPKNKNTHMTSSETKKEVEPRYEAWERILDEMIESGEFVWAEETLTGIRDTIIEKKDVTKNQMQAIHNIRRSVQ